MHNIANVSQSAIQVVLDHVSRGDHATADNDEERTILHLMCSVNAASMKVPGSSAA